MKCQNKFREKTLVGSRLCFMRTDGWKNGRSSWAGMREHLEELTHTAEGMEIGEKQGVDVAADSYHLTHTYKRQRIRHFQAELAEQGLRIG